MQPVARRPRGRSAARRGAVGLLVAVLACGSLAGLAAAVVDSPPVGAATCGPAPQGQVAVSVVIDRGTGAPSVRCAVVAQGSTGLDAMRAAGHDVRLDGGFVCGIDGLPASGCGNRPDAGFAYWRYWHAVPGGAWSYSQVGAGGYRLPARCAVEGWVWSDAPSSDTPPRVAPPTPTCDAPVVTAAPTTAPPTRGTPTVPSAGATSPGGGGGAAPPSGSGGTAAAPGAAPPAVVEGATTVAPDAATTSTEPGVGAGDERVGDAREPSSSGDGRDATAQDGELAAAASPDGGSPAPWGVLAAVLLVGGLGATGWWRSRARRRDVEPS